MTRYTQQGDVLLKETISKKGFKAINSDLLYKGESHHHRLKGKFKILKKENEVLVESSGCVLFHEEHNDVKVPKGLWALDIVKEYDHLLEESRRVID